MQNEEIQIFLLGLETYHGEQSGREMRGFKYSF